MPRILFVLLLLVSEPLIAQDQKSVDLATFEGLAQAVKGHLVPDLVIIDVRDPELYRSGHLPQAVNIPVAQIPTAFPSKSALTTLVVYGRPASADSRKAVDILRVRGYRNVILFGSISQWQGELQ